MIEFFKVKPRGLLLIAGIVWLIAGFNVARLGVIAYTMITIKRYYFLLSLLVFLPFGIMFFNMTKKHAKRILSYESKQPFWKFFDLKSYLIMAVMMGGGIGLRAAGVFTDLFVAIFYSGLGVALALAGVVFVVRYIALLFQQRKENRS